MTDDDPDPHQFLLFWCTDGLESVIDVDAYVRERVALVLASDCEQQLPTSLDTTLALFSWRARLNSQRNYELYGIGMPTGTTEQDIFDMFDTNYRSMQDLVRKRGIAIPII